MIGWSTKQGIDFSQRVLVASTPDDQGDKTFFLQPLRFVSSQRTIKFTHLYTLNPVYELIYVSI